MHAPHANSAWQRLGMRWRSRHFVAVSTNAREVSSLGIDTANMFGFSDWVGDRHSMDSAIGLSTMLAFARSASSTCWRGFALSTSISRRPGWGATSRCCWGCCRPGAGAFFGAQTAGVMPYSRYLKRFAAYPQQLTMESNGKRVTREGRPVDYETGAVYCGEPGTTGQRSSYQLIHEARMAGLIADHLAKADDPVAAAARLSRTTGVVEYGLLAPALVSEVARGERVDRITRP